MTQDGEKEFVLGNKQLLSFFFVMVALCGVFFAVGYMIGFNAAQPSATETKAPVTSAPAEGQRSPLPPVETKADPKTDPPLPSTEPPSTKPAQEPAAEVKTEAPAVNPNRIVPVTVPEKGAPYLQVTALARPDAEAVVRTLKEQGFPAILTESSREGFFRVLVGPYKEAAQLGASRDRLRALGFANTLVHRQ